jgi:hypothetical protein
MLHHPKTWFVPKSDGWGLWPRTWEGWVVIAAIVAVAYVVSHFG